jgi:hypothetical protein
MHDLGGILQCALTAGAYLAGTHRDIDAMEDELMIDGAALKRILAPARLVNRAEVLAKPCPVPPAPGVYAWYFDRAPGSTPIAGTQVLDGWRLLYVGISPKAPSRDGQQISRQTLRTRIRYHYRGNAYGSTLRLTLGCLLAEDLGIQLRRVGTGTRLTFADGEAALSNWMSLHARVCWVTTEQPWALESALIGKLTLPLNLDQNARSPFHHVLTKVRAKQRAAARSLPIWRP